MNSTLDDSRYNGEENREGHTSSPRKTPYAQSQGHDNTGPIYSSSPNQEGTTRRKRPRVGDMRNQNLATGYNNNRYNNDRTYQNRYNNRYNNDQENYRNNNYGNNNRYNNRNNNDGYNNQYNNTGYNNKRQYNNNNRYNKTQNPKGYNNNSDQHSHTPNKKQFNKKKTTYIKPVKYTENIDPNTPIRLNKYLANAGICSRREADTLIQTGVVKVNGVVASQLGTKVTRGDLITFHDEPVKLESKVYVLLNKPKKTLTTSDDPKNRRTVMDLVKNACPERIFPVGRLDKNTTGVLLLTNDGDLASKLMHPKYLKKKIYQVKLDKDVTMEHMQAIADGIELDDGEIHADSIAYVAEDVFDEIGIEIHSGRNRLVRRIFEKLGYQVVKLDRVYFAGLTKKNLGRGKWRYLNEQEVNMLRMGAFQ